jgi:hypothetical protein
VGWITLPRDLLEQQFESLGLEKNHFETGVKDPDSVNGTERLSDYPDPEEDARCAGSLEVVNPQDLFVRESSLYRYVNCRTCGKTAYAEWRNKKQGWVKVGHHGAPLVSEDPVQ